LGRAVDDDLGLAEQVIEGSGNRDACSASPRQWALAAQRLSGQAEVVSRPEPQSSCR